MVEGHPVDAVLYARLLPRFKALVIDLAVYAGVTVFFVAIVPAASIDIISTLGFVAWMSTLVLYEPVMVWRFGGTLGHMRQNLRVVSDRSGQHPGPLQSLVRWFSKGVIGVLSFFFMAVTQRHQALHDQISRTTVQVRDMDRVRPAYFVSARSTPAGAVDVSVARRIAVILGYQVVIFLALSVASALVLSEACLWEDVCTEGDDLLTSVLGLAWMLTGGVTIVLGWKGRLFGARGGRAT